MKRIERLKERTGPKNPIVVLVYEDGRRQTMTFLEAFDFICNTPGIVSAEMENPTACSLLNALITGGQDLSDIEELQDQRRE